MIAFTKDQPPLTTAQKEALRYDKSIVIEACAGSGKTTMLVQRFLHLLWENPSLRANQILAITYTKKAAAEMRARLHTLCQVHQDDNDELALFKTRVQSELYRAHITTIHGFCNSLIQKFPFELNCPPNAPIIEGDLLDLMKLDCIHDYLDLLKTKLDTRLSELLIRYSESELVTLIQTYFSKHDICSKWHKLIHDQITRTSIVPNTLSDDETRVTENGIEITDQILSIAQESYLFYGQKKREKGVLDYDDLITLCLKGLETEKIRRYYQHHFRYVFVDECQDTNSAQWTIINALVSDDDPFKTDKLFIVGDRFQSIYSFRGTDPSLFQDTVKNARQGHTHFVSAHDNFRSNSELIHFLNPLFNTIFKDTLDFPHITPFRPKLEEPAIEAAIFPNDTTKTDHFTFIADWIQNKVKNKGKKYSDIAILLRQKSQMEQLRNALSKNGVPATIYGGLGLFEKQEVIDIVNLVTALHDPHNDTAWVGVLKSPLFGLSDDALWVLRLAIQDQPFFEGLSEKSVLATDWQDHLSNTDATLVQDACNSIHRWVSLQQLMPLSKCLATILEERQAWSLYHYINPESVHNIEKCLAKIQGWEFDSFRNWHDIPKLLHHHFHNRHLEATENPEDGNCVRIMTIHAAKGLEFPIVILPELDKGYNLSYGDPMLVTHQAGIGLSYSENDIKHAWRTHVMAQHKQDTCNEESRLFYVACTRARDQLLFVGHNREKRRLPSYLDLLLEQATCLYTESKIVFFQGKSHEQRFPLYGDTVQKTAQLELPKKTSNHHPKYEIPSQAWPTPQKWTMSISDIHNALACPKTFYYRRLIQAYQGIEDGKVIESAAFGDKVHKILAYLAQHRYPNFNSKDPKLLDLLGSEIEGPIKKHIDTVLTTDMWSKICQSTHIQTEVPFTLTISDVSVSGRIDLLFKQGDTWHIIDYKTQRGPATLTPTIQTQLSLYEHAICAQHPQDNVRSTILFTASGDCISGESGDILTDIQRLKKTLTQQPFISPPKEQCLKCPIYKHNKDCPTQDHLIGQLQ